jgi:hypothetical protein
LSRRREPQAGYKASYHIIRASSSTNTEVTRLDLGKLVQALLPLLQLHHISLQPDTSTSHRNHGPSPGFCPTFALVLGRRRVRLVPRG